MKRFFLVVMAVLIAVPTFAGYTNYSGNTRPQIPDGVGATINFAVLYWDGHETADVWGTGYDQFDRSFQPGVDARGNQSPRLDRGARYLYLYQTVNDGEFGKAVEYSSIGVHPRAVITSWGEFRGMTLADDKDGTGKLTPVSTENAFGPKAPSGGSPAPALMGKVKWPGVLPLGSLLSAEEVVLFPTEFRAVYQQNPIQTGEVGSLFGFTSPYPPTLDLVKVKGFKDQPSP